MGGGGWWRGGGQPRAAAESGISSDQGAAAQHTTRGRTTAKTKTKRLINKQMKRFFNLQGGAEWSGTARESDITNPEECKAST